MSGQWFKVGEEAQFADGLRLLDNVDKAMERLRPRLQKLGYREEDVRPFVQSVIYL